MAQLSRLLAVFPRAQFGLHHSWLTTLCNSSSRGLDAIFWAPRNTHKTFLEKQKFQKTQEYNKVNSLSQKMEPDSAASTSPSLAEKYMHCTCCVLPCTETKPDLIPGSFHLLHKQNVKLLVPSEKKKRILFSGVSGLERDVFSLLFETTQLCKTYGLTYWSQPLMTYVYIPTRNNYTSSRYQHRTTVPTAHTLRLSVGNC